MKHVSRLLLTVLVLAIVGVGLTYLFASRDPREGQSLAGWILLELRRADALENRASEISQSMEIKKAVVEDLVAERLTLREAAEQFRQADQLIEKDSTGLVAPYYSPRTEAGLYQQVIVWTKTELSDDPEHANQVLPRLEQELAQQQLGEDAAE